MDQLKLKKKLINLFAAHSTAEIEAGNGTLLKQALGVEKYRRLLRYQDDAFKKYYLTLKDLRDRLDDAAAETETLDQVKGCLLLLLNTKESNVPAEHFDLLSGLINKGVYLKWNGDEKKYYDAGWDMIAVWKDYFLSYTNRNRVETNNNFKSILADVFGDKYFRENKESVNGVAGLIVHYLKQNNLTAFFDRDNMKCGDMIEEEVFTHCKSVYAFVQLVEPGIFQPREENKKNWCAEEYKTFARWSSQNCLNSYKRYYFILAEKDVYPAYLPPYYEDWKKEIEDHLDIPDLSSLNKQRVRELIGEIAGEIVKTKKHILEDYLG